MFPVDSETLDFHSGMMEIFHHQMEQRGIQWKLKDILPEIRSAGEEGGVLTPEGAALIDPTGTLQAGSVLCPPEGDAGTGMTATNSVAPHTGNVSAGTSVFAMAVLENELQDVHPEIDMVTTPAGKPVAMVHCNNCTNEINAWAGIFGDVAKELGGADDTDKLYTAMFQAADRGDKDCGGIVVYNYLSGEPVTGLQQGSPLMYRLPGSTFSYPNFMRAQLYSACATLKVGMDILFQEEGITLKHLLGHGGFFKTPKVGQKIMAAAMNTPVAVMETAGEGGAWGAALLAAYTLRKRENQSLEEYLEEDVFCGNQGSTVAPDREDVEGFETFMKAYRAGLDVERAAANTEKIGE
jgi:sugar (pentulose or hexulose) kinase